MIESLRLFHKELEGNQSKSFESVNFIALKRGFLVTFDACTADTLEYLEAIQINPNATFYKTWNDIISKSRFELYIDQLKHYASTYGTNFTGPQYVPNDDDITLPDMKEITVIDTISKSSLIEKCLNMLYSGIALKEETLIDVQSILTKLNTVPDIDLIKNKEAKMLYCKRSNTIPSNPEELVRFLIYISTGETLLIKSASIIDGIRRNPIKLSKYITKDNIKSAASVFYRYKPIFLAMKRTADNCTIINKLRKLAVKYHQPKKPSFWSNVITSGATSQNILDHLDTINNFKKVTIINELLRRKVKDIEHKPYYIRNGKMFVGPLKHELKKNDQLCLILCGSLVESLSKKKCKVKFPKDIDIALPSSEKSFVGDYPLYSNIPITKDTIFGIYWKEEWGTKDFDLSYMNKGGDKIGWDGNYTNKDSVIFSGDMTHADPEATELLYFPDGYNGLGILNVDRYSKEQESSLNVFVAKEKIDKMKENYMVNPDDIIFSNHVSPKSHQRIYGIIAHNKIYLTDINDGNDRVSYDSESTEGFLDYVVKTIDSHLSLKRTLLLAGFIEDEENPDIDFTKLDKATLIELLS